MDKITSVSSISNWVGNDLVRATYTHTTYPKGNDITKVSYHITAQVYDVKGELQYLKNIGKNIDFTV